MTKKNSSRFIRNCIFEALMILMESKDYDDITVSEIADKAGVSRMTYYRTYANKEDIVVQHCKDTLEAIRSSYANPALMTFQSRAILLFQEIQRSRTLSKAILKTPVLYAAINGFFAQYIQEQLEKFTDLKGTALHYQSEFIAGGLVRMAACWIYADFKPSPDEMGKLLVQLAPSFTSEKKAV